MKNSLVTLLALVPCLVTAAPSSSGSEKRKNNLQQLLWLLWESSSDSSSNSSTPIPGGGSDQMMMPSMPLSAYKFPYQSQAFDQLRVNMTQEQILYHHIFRRYNKAVRPVGGHGHVVTVHLGMTLSQITDIDMKQQKMVAMFWCDQEWIDHRLSWDPAAFFGIRRLHVNHHKLWTPDIVLYNSVGKDGEEVETPLENLAMIRSDGTVVFAPVNLYHSFCRLDVTFFPFDYQFCWLKLGSWAHTGDVLNIDIRGAGIDTSNHVGNGEWELLGTRAVRNVKFYPCCPEPFPEVFFYFQFRRRILYYVFSVIAPCIIMSSVAMFAFCLPTECSEKVTLGLTVLLAYTVFQLTTAESMPKTSEFLAYISIYFTVVILTTSLTVFFSILVVGVKESGRIKGKCPPRWLLRGFAFFNLIPLDLIRSCDVFTPSRRRKALLKACFGGKGSLPQLSKAVIVHHQPAVFEFHLRDELDLLSRSHSPFCRLVPQVDGKILRSYGSFAEVDILPRDIKKTESQLPFDSTSNITAPSAYKTWSDKGVKVVDVDDDVSHKTDNLQFRPRLNTEVVWESRYSSRETAPKVRLIGTTTADNESVRSGLCSLTSSTVKGRTPIAKEDSDSELLVGLKTQVMRKEAEKAARQIRSGVEQILYRRYMAREWVAVYMALDTILFYVFIAIHLINTLGFIILVPWIAPAESLDFLIGQHLKTLNITQAAR